MDDTGLRFDANMSENQHAHFNQLLNMRVEESADPSYPHARLRYTHTRELDSFHQVPTPGGGGPPRKVRVTRDQKDPTKVRAVEKIRVADMNIYSPKRLFDWRVSVSLEIPSQSHSLPICGTFPVRTDPSRHRAPPQPPFRKVP